VSPYIACAGPISRPAPSAQAPALFRLHGPPWVATGARTGRYIHARTHVHACGLAPLSNTSPSPTQFTLLVHQVQPLPCTGKAHTAARAADLDSTSVRHDTADAVSLQFALLWDHRASCAPGRVRRVAAAVRASGTTGGRMDALRVVRVYCCRTQQGGTEGLSDRWLSLTRAARRSLSRNHGDVSRRPHHCTLQAADVSWRMGSATRGAVHATCAKGALLPHRRRSGLLCV